MLLMSKETRFHEKLNHQLYCLMQLLVLSGRVGLVCLLVDGDQHQGGRHHKTQGSRHQAHKVLPAGQCVVYTRRNPKLSASSRNLQIHGALHQMQRLSHGRKFVYMIVC